MGGEGFRVVARLVGLWLVGWNVEERKKL